MPRMCSRFSALVLLVSVFALTLGSCGGGGGGEPPPEIRAPSELTAELGRSIRFAVSAVAADRSSPLPVEVVAPFPLPPNAGFTPETGQFSYTPTAMDVGLQTFVFQTTAPSGRSVQFATNVAVTARPANSVTELAGVVLDSDSAAPIAGVEIRVGSLTATTDVDGRFQVAGLTMMDTVVEVDGGTAPPGDRWTFVAEDLELVLEHMLHVGQVNVIERPIYLPELGPSVGVIDPAQTSMLENTTLGVALEVAAGSAMMGTTMFQGDMFMPRVAPERTPASLPRDLQPDLVVAIQPAGLVFDPPAQLTWPNTEGLEPGSMVDIFSIDPESGLFVDVGDALVSNDGATMRTVAGGVRNSSWHFTLPGEPGGSGSGDDQNGENEDKDDECAENGSRIAVQSGNVGESHTLASYRSVGQERALRLVYNSDAAYPCPILNTTAFVPSGTSIPDAVRTTLVLGGVRQPMELFTQPSRDAVRIACQIDATSYPTGWYNHEVEVASLYPNSSRTTRVFGSTLVVNERDSAVGAGWSIDGVAQIRRVPGWPFVALTEGDGSIKTFTPLVAGGPRIRTELCFTIDGSCSMRGSPWTLQMQGMETLVADPLTVPQDGSVAIAVVQFHSTGQGAATIEVPLTVIDSQATADMVAAQIAAVPHRTSSCGNPMGVGINRAVEALSMERGNRQVICITSDGDPGNDAFANASADNAIGVGVDSIEILAIGAGANIERLSPVVRNGALTIVPTFAEFAQAAGDKLRRVISGAPAAEFSCLMANPDGSFTREFLDGSSQEFGTDGLQTALVDPAGNRTEYTYDGGQRLTSVRCPAGSETQLLYDAAGMLQTVRLPDGTATTLVHDGDDLIGIMDPDGAMRSFQYDVEHRLLAQSDASGNQKSYEYDSVSGRLARATDAEGGVLALEPSQTAGLLEATQSSRAAPLAARMDDSVTSRIIDKLGNESSVRTDRFGRAREIVDALGSRTVLGRNVNGQLEETTTARGRVDERQYDANGNLTLLREAVGTSLVRETRYRYDPDHDWMIQRVDANGGVTEFEYDAAGNMTLITSPDGTTQSMTYDARGLTTSSTDANGNETRYAYTAAGLLETVTNALGEVTRYQHDARGNVLAEIRGAGSPAERVRRYTYDAMGRVLTSADGGGALTRFVYDVDGNQTATSLPAESGVVQRGYDRMGRMRTVTDPTRGSMTIGYDAIGNIVSRQDSLGRVTALSYDALGRLETVTDPNSGVERREYDEAGNLVRHVAPDGAVTTMTYDLLDRRTSMALPGGRRQTWEYDALDNVTREGRGGSATLRRDYDNLSRVTRIRVPAVNGAPSNDIRFSYDDAGNLLGVTDADSRLEMSYDALNRVTEERTAAGGSQPVVALTSRYNAVGDRVELSDSLGGAQRYGYDAAGRLASLDVPGAGVIGFAHDAAGRTAETRFPNGIIGRRSYAPGTAQLTSIVHGLPAAAPVLSLGLGWNAVGDLAGVDDARTGPSTLSYDALSRLTSVVDGVAGPESYSYDMVGNRSASHLSAAVSSSDDNRVLENDSFTYGYDAQGNRSSATSRAAPSESTAYIFDGQDQLVRVDLPGGAGSVSFRYDGLGRRIGKTLADGSERHFVCDTEEVLLEFDAAGSLVARYGHGERADHRVAMVRGGAAFYYHTDWLDSVRAVTDGSGTVVNRYDYEGYGLGVAATLTEGVENGYQFTGREHEPSVGLYYYRARWMDPRTGTFVSEDPLRELSGTWNFYGYVEQRPTALTDPSGLTPWGLIFGGADLAYQLYQNGGNLSCVSWGQVGLSMLGGGALNAIAKGAFRFKTFGSHTWNATRSWMNRRGIQTLRPGQHRHHWLLERNQGIGRHFPDWVKNQPWNTNPISAQFNNWLGRHPSLAWLGGPSWAAEIAAGAGTAAAGGGSSDPCECR